MNKFKLLAGLLLLLVVGNAQAGLAFSTTGEYTYDGTDTFTILDAVVSAFGLDPAGDAIVGDTVSTPTLTLTAASLVAGGPTYSFDPNQPPPFKIAGNIGGNNYTATANLASGKLVIGGNTANINAALKINLTGWSVTGYTIGSGSSILDALSGTNAAAAINYTLNKTGSDFQTALNNGDTFRATYSSSFQVPEPTPLALLGLGLSVMGLARARGRKPRG